MDGVIDLARARELVGNAALWPRVRDFLWDFAPQVHASWLEGLPGLETLDARREGNSSLAPCLMSSPRTKSFLLSSLGVTPCFHDFPKEDGSRLLLLDGATLEKVVQWLGALACADELRRVTDGATVRALRAALPGVYPDVFGYTAYFKGLDAVFVSRGDAESQRTEVRVTGTGYEILAAALAGLPASLVLRLKFKLPRSLGASAPLRETKPPPAEALRSAILKLLKLKFPEAYSLCCS